MRIRSIVTVVALMATLAASADAGQINNLQLYDSTSGSPVVTVNYTNPDGNGLISATTWADPQVSGNTSTPIYYCIDLWHDNYLGSSYAFTPATQIAYGASTTFGDVDNRLAWLISQPQDTVDERAAVQLAMWYTIDNVGFTYSGGDSTLRTEYTNLISFSGYDQSEHYSAQFWSATRSPGSSLYQDLISASTFGTQSVPEPGTLLLAGIGLTVIAGWRRFRGR